MLAVIDWELCALGNPLADVAYMLLMYLPISGFIFNLGKYTVFYYKYIIISDISDKKQ